MADLVLAAVLVGLAAYRVWRIIARDQITEPYRAPLISRSDRPAFKWLCDLIDCPWCLGWWLCGAGVVALDLTYPINPVEGILVWCAASTITGLLGRLDT